MTTRKILTMTAGALLALSMAACGAPEQKSEVKEEPTQTATDDSKGTDSEKTSTASSSEASSDGKATEASDIDTSIYPSGIQDTPIENGYETGKHEAVIVVKDYGTIKLELDADAAPITVSNFADLANRNFYDGLTFHRIMRNFMIQGGDPLHDGTGGSDSEIKGEFSKNGVENPLHHTRGTISMARNAVSMDSARSQFFICDADNPTLDGEYAAFGHVTEGMEVVDQIAKDANPIDANGTIPPAEQPVIESIRVGDGSLG